MASPKTTPSSQSSLRQRARPSSSGSDSNADGTPRSRSRDSSSPAPTEGSAASTISVYDESGNKIETNKDKDKKKNKDNTQKGKVDKKWTNEQEIILRKWAEVAKSLFMDASAGLFQVSLAKFLVFNPCNYLIKFDWHSQFCSVIDSR